MRICFSSSGDFVRSTKRAAAGAGDFDRFIFIVGAPRCGTTTLWRFLQDHPAITPPIVKEPHFFAQHDLRTLSDEEVKQRVERDYLQRFYCGPRRGRIGVDASVSYLYGPEQLEPVLRLWPDSRFIVALRDPLAMLPSLHQRLIYVGEETVPKFEDAWAAVQERANGRKLPRACDDSRLFRYDEAGRFGTYLQRLHAAVGPERCSVVVFDDLVADPSDTYARLMAFAGLEQRPNVDFCPRRSGRAVRSRTLQRLLKRPPKMVRDRLGGELYRQRVRDLADLPDRSLMRSILAVRKRIIQWNTISRSPEAVPLGLQNEIRLCLKDEIDRVSHILGRDLGHWLQPRFELAEAPRTEATLPYQSAFALK